MITFVRESEEDRAKGAKQIANLERQRMRQLLLNVIDNCETGEGQSFGWVVAFNLPRDLIYYDEGRISTKIFHILTAYDRNWIVESQIDALKQLLDDPALLPID